LFKNFNENSTSQSNLNSLNLQSVSPEKSVANTGYSQISSENLYDEYKRRLELIKKLKPTVNLNQIEAKKEANTFDQSQKQKSVFLDFY